MIRYAIGSLLGLQLVALVITGLEYRHLVDGRDDLQRMRSALESEAARVARPENPPAAHREKSQKPAIPAAKECPPLKPESGPTAPEAASLSSVWILPHPPENRGRFLTFASFRQGSIAGRPGAVLFREWNGKEFVETQVPLMEVQWDAGRR